MDMNRNFSAEVPDIDAVSDAARRACLYVALSAASLIGGILLAGAPRSISSLAMTVTTVVVILNFPVSAYLAAWHILKYIRLLHEYLWDMEFPE